MSEPSKAPFVHPIQIGVLEHFCHPHWRGLAVPCWHDGDALAACGWIAIRSHGGVWMRDGSDFPAADEEFLSRFDRLPWGSFEFLLADAANWQALRDANIFRYGPLRLWGKNGRPHPSPVWQVAQSPRVRLSHLQLVSRLPRCEVYTGPASALFFRFTGGRGIIAQDEKLTENSCHIFQPRRHDDGTLMDRRTTPKPNFMPPPPEEPRFPDWPPVEAADDSAPISFHD